MSFQPVVPLSGWAGWKFLERTRQAQQEAFDRSAVIERETTYFTERIAAVRSASELVADRRLLAVALGAFGLDDDIANRFFIRKVLEEGTRDPQALANRLSDARYREFSKAFGFGDLDPPNTVLSDFGASIAARYRERQFEIAVGRQDQTMRLALTLERELSSIAGTQTTDDGRWFLVMAKPPLREVFETALGLPASLGALDLDRQMSEFRRAASTRLGEAEISQFARPEQREALLRLYLARASPAAAAVSAAGGATVALSLLQSMTSSNG
ncbi:MAG: DUF1217 domain-containing protein [Alphaproteobacteria bacterium]|nr:MAG: DUF1217 domain-containing protein [Alphaproteobacteria bacterium]